MHSIRTGLSIFEKKEFEQFLKDQGIKNVLVGDYTDTSGGLLYSVKRLCYAYSDKDESETLTYMKLKHGSLELAYYMYQLEGTE
jgi:hypothetical protein